MDWASYASNAEVQTVRSAILGAWSHWSETGQEVSLVWPVGLGLSLRVGNRWLRRKEKKRGLHWLLI